MVKVKGFGSAGNIFDHIDYQTLVIELVNVTDMKAFWNVKHAIHALDNLLSMVEIMGNPVREPEIEDTSLRPSEGL